MTMSQNLVVVIDIEATCWETSPPSGQQNEIIEIGVCSVGLEAAEIYNKRSILIKPTRSKISRFCTKLTTLTQEQVDAGVSFDEACQILIAEYSAENLLWGSWGNYDRKMLVSQCETFYVSYPFSENHVNIKTLFAEYANKSKAVGMARALKMLKFELDGTHHRGHDDAWNISRILLYLVETYGQSILDPYLVDTSS